MPRRFEIIEIAHQNQDGVTFRSLDKTTNQIVSLRRFFPFGQLEEEEETEGLNPQDAQAYTSACERLTAIQHSSLRKTIFGSTDPVDGMPFLVTEWIEGESLANLLGDNVMEPSMIIDLLRKMLDVCIVLSDALENEAVWVDTKTAAIIVNDPPENPAFYFRICPYKWLDTKPHKKDLLCIVGLVEILTGWKSQLVSDQAGMGLGGWLKLLRQDPQMGLKVALQALPNHHDELATEDPVTPYQPFSKAPTPALASANQSMFTKKNIIIMTISAFVTVAIIVIFYIKNKEKQESNALANEEIYTRIEESETVDDNTVTNLETSNKPTITGPVSTSPNEDITAKAAKMMEDLKKADALKVEQQAALKKGPIILSPDNLDELEGLDLNIPVKIEGVVKSVEIPPTGTVIHIAFSNPADKEQIRVVLYPSGFDAGKFKNNFKAVESKYQSLLNKNVVFEGFTNKFANMENPAFVRVDSHKNIKIVKP
jgi:hypothetical protein